MGVLASFLSSVFATVFSVFSAGAARKVALAAVYSTTVLALTAGLYSAVQLLVTGLVPVIANADLVMVLWSIWPDNAGTCIAAIGGVRAASFLYRIQRDIAAVASGG